MLHEIVIYTLHGLHINDAVHFHNFFIIHENYSLINLLSYYITCTRHIWVISFLNCFSLFLLPLDHLSFLSLSRLPRFNEPRLTFFPFCFISTSKRYFGSKEQKNFLLFVSPFLPWAKHYPNRFDNEFANNDHKPLELNCCLSSLTCILGYFF